MLDTAMRRAPSGEMDASLGSCLLPRDAEIWGAAAGRVSHVIMRLSLVPALCPKRCVGLFDIATGQMKTNDGNH